MPSRKKKWVLLRGKLSGLLIVGSRAWYEHEKVSKLWKLVTQNNDEAVLIHMMKLGNKPNESLNNNLDKWVDTKQR